MKVTESVDMRIFRRVRDERDAARAEVERLREALTAAALGEPGWRESAMRLAGIDPVTAEAGKRASGET